MRDPQCSVCREKAAQHRTQKTVAITLVALATKVIVSFISRPSGMSHAYLYWAKLDQCTVSTQ